MSDSNVQYGISWDKYPKETPLEYKLFDQKRNELIEKTVSDVNQQANGLLAFNASLNEMGLSVDQIEQVNNEIAGQITGINNNVNDVNGQIENLSGEVAKAVTNTDYAKELVGGVVLLANNIIPLSGAASSTALAAYDQAEEQSYRDVVTSSLNDIISKINAIIDGQKLAKQMSDN